MKRLPARRSLFNLDISLDILISNVDRVLRLIIETRPDSWVPVGATTKLQDIIVGQVGLFPSSLLLVRRWGILVRNNLLQAKKEVNTIGGIRGIRMIWGRRQGILGRGARF